ncbi:MAG: DNA primase [Clostridia bacterium]|nr:DNA primase [Clostridia bacterium]
MAYNSNGGLTPSFLDELKFKCDIVSIISGYIRLDKKGGKYFGCCPFHNEKTPSFCVNADEQYYHCFGCGVSGNVINFVMEMESLSFYDAVKLLAERAGMEMPEMHLDPDYKKKKEKKDILHGLMKDTAHYYRNNLLRENEGKEAREYLQSRGISEDIARYYGIGLSLDNEHMPAYMRRKSYTIENLRDCGLVYGQDSSLKDAFGGRIIVPILDGMGNVVAFGGRIYHGEKDVAKYKNSTNTEIFDKGRTVYGINFVKKEKKENGGFKELILVEGYMDVIALGSVGIKNVVAGMGTALTDGQAREIARLVPMVYVCYDGDSAGRKATIKNVETLMRAGLEVKVVSLADGCDPDDTIKNEGYEGFIKRVREALPVIEYKLKLCLDAYGVDSVDGKAKYVRAALKVLQDVKSVAEREVYLAIVSKLSGVSVETLTKDLGKAPVVEKDTPTPQPPQIKEDKTVKASRFILNKLLTKSPCARADIVKVEWLASDLYKSLLEEYNSTDGEVKIGSLFDKFEDPELNNIVGDDVVFDEDANESTYFTDCVLVLANEYISKALSELTKKYNGATDATEKRAIIAEMASLQQKLKSKKIEDKF